MYTVKALNQRGFYILYLFPWSFNIYRIIDVCGLALLFIQCSWAFLRFIAKLSCRIFINNWGQAVIFYCFFVFLFFHSNTPCFLDQNSSWYELSRIVVLCTHSGSCISEEKLKGPYYCKVFLILSEVFLKGTTIL